MRVGELFRRDVTRPIEEVIKIDVGDDVAVERLAQLLGRRGSGV